MMQEPVVNKTKLAHQSLSLSDSSPPIAPRTKRQKASLLNDKNMYLAIEADLSGDDVAGGSSDSEGVESESDRAFAGNFIATQAPAGYDQDMIYRQSLLSQVPKNAPAFTSAAVRRGAFNFRRPAIPQQQHSSSSPRRIGDTTDEYEMDSFVVGDDEELVQMTSSSQS